MKRARTFGKLEAGWYGDPSHPVHHLFTRRAILVTGKGGVGKTTVAAGLARAAAEAGKRVLAAEVSFEPQSTSPLARALGTTLFAEEPQSLAPNLQGVMLTPHAGHLSFLRDTLPMRMLADAAMKAAAVRRFLLAAPTLAEMGILYRMLDLLRRTRSDGEVEHEVMVVDLPATGHALGLAQIPDAIVDVIHSGPIHDAVQEGLKLLRDPAKTTSVVVTLPEILPVSEAIELVLHIHTHRIPFSQIVLNRVPHDPFTVDERAAIDALVQDKVRMLGARRLPRIDHARHAVVRLRDEHGLDVRTVPEMGERGDVSREVAAALLGGPA